MYILKCKILRNFNFKSLNLKLTHIMYVMFIYLYFEFDTKMYAQFTFKSKKLQCYFLMKTSITNNKLMLYSRAQNRFRNFFKMICFQLGNNSNKQPYKLPPSFVSMFSTQAINQSHRSKWAQKQIEYGTYFLQHFFITRIL